MPTAEAAPSAPLLASVAAAKASLRARMKTVRAAALAADPTLSDQICARLLAEVPMAAGPVSGFWPLAGEIDVRPALSRLHALSRVCALPVVQGAGRPLCFRRWAPGDVLEPRGRFAIPEPAESAEPVVPRVLLVPLLAFDRRGGRLGYGAGFYDRTLAELRAAGPVQAIGVALSVMEVDAVPVDMTDQPLDLVVTDAAVIGMPRGAG